MDRADRTGIGAAVAGHLLLFGALSLGLFASTRPLIPPTTPVDVELIDEIALKDASPRAAKEAPAASIAPEVGPSREEPPPPEAQPTPLPPHAETPPPPPKPTAVAPPKPVKPSPPQPAKPVPSRLTPAKPAASKPVIAEPAPSKSKETARGSRLGPDFLKGISDRPSTSTSDAPRAPIGPAQLASLASAIRRQVQPCADRIASPGPGAENITTKLNLQMNRDGSLAAAPRVVSQMTDGDNARYAGRVGELARAAFQQCAPFELPPDLYDGWRNINLNYKLPG